MRTLLIFGLLGLFVVVSFVPPGTEQARAERQPMEYSVSVEIPDADEVRTALQALFSALQIPASQESDADYDTESRDVSRASADMEEKEVMPVGEETERIPSKEVDPDEGIRALFAAIEWAREKDDVRACHDLPPRVVDERTVEGTKMQTPAKGDWIAYCLARVTRQKKRCTQITTHTSPNLRELCETEFL